MYDKKCSVLTAVALAACLFLGVSGGTVGTAKAVDLDQDCSLTVSPGTIDDLKNAEVVIDLYRVADAIPVSGYDTYAYEAVAPFDTLGDALADAESLSNKVYQDLAQEAADIIFNGKTAVEPTVQGAEINAPISPLSSGLYLAIARGPEIPDYVVSVADGKEEKLATIAWSDEYIYTFLPELISLPTKDALEPGGEVNTANPGKWIYDAKPVLKPSQSIRFGSLEIEKILTSYETSEPANFVFQVEAYKDETKTEVVYSNVVSLSFTSAGEKTALLEKVIPVGSYVEVTEVYSGATYTLTSAETMSAVIQAEELASVSFTNDYDGSGNSGGAVTNHFDYSKESGWGWTQE